MAKPGILMNISHVSNSDHSCRATIVFGQLTVGGGYRDAGKLAPDGERGSSSFGYVGVSRGSLTFSV